jgi:hypothetical protein
MNNVTFMGSLLKDCLLRASGSWARVRACVALLGVLALTGCANVSTTVFRYSDGQGGSVMVEMPKEIEAKDLHVSINAKTGTALITAKEWSSKNSETIDSQAKREAQVLDKAGGLVEKGSEGAARGAMKGLIPVP